MPYQRLLPLQILTKIYTSRRVETDYHLGQKGLVQHSVFSPLLEFTVKLAGKTARK